MNAFSKLISEFSALTGLELSADGNDSCTLESNGIYITLQYRNAADDVVIFAPVVVSEDYETLPKAALEKALSLAYDGQGTAGAFLGLCEGALVLSLHLAMQGLDAQMLGLRLSAFADAAENIAAEIAAKSEFPEELAASEAPEGMSEPFLRV